MNKAGAMGHKEHDGMVLVKRWASCYMGTREMFVLMTVLAMGGCGGELSDVVASGGSALVSTLPDEQTPVIHSETVQTIASVDPQANVAAVATTPESTVAAQASTPEATDLVQTATEVPLTEAAQVSDQDVERESVTIAQELNPEPSESNPEPSVVEQFTPPESTVIIGDVSTRDVQGVVFSSLPSTTIQTNTASAELGRLLFWDPILSGDQDTACATCHLPSQGYSDGRARSVGTSGVGTGAERVAGQIGEVHRNAQTVLNTVWNGISELGMFDTAVAPMFWDNRTASLVKQAVEPIHAREEMRGDNVSTADIDRVITERLSANSEYQQRFADAFNATTVTMGQVAQALADFQSTLVANNAPYDLWMRGDTNAMTAQQVRGLEVFAQTGCADCHSGPMFSDYDTHVLGVPEAQGLTEPDRGDGEFGFRTPTLRQLTLTAPYFHGGQESTLQGVIDFYDNPRRSANPHVATDQLDPDFRDLPRINTNQAVAIEAFLQSLTDANFDQLQPERVPSGLPVGGSL